MEWIDWVSSLYGGEGSVRIDGCHTVDTKEMRVRRCRDSFGVVIVDLEIALKSAF